MVRYIYSLIFLLFLVQPCHAQNYDDNVIPTGYSNRNSGLSSGLGVERHDVGDLRLTSASLDLVRRDYHLDFPDYWDSYVNRPRITYSYKYRGLRKIIYKQINRGLRNLYDRALKTSIEASYAHPLDFDRSRARYGLEASDAGSRWWEERVNFFDHYSIENGGHRFKQITVGEDYDVVSVGPVTLTSSGRFSWSGWRFSLSPERDLEKRNSDLQYTAAPQVARTRHYSLGIHTPKGNLYENDMWGVSMSVKLGVRVNDLTMENRSSVTCNINITGFTGPRRIPWLAVKLKGKARPLRNDYALYVTVSLLAF